MLFGVKYNMKYVVIGHLNTVLESHKGMSRVAFQSDFVLGVT
jgi:hypothetical protein